MEVLGGLDVQAVGRVSAWLAERLDVRTAGRLEFRAPASLTHQRTASPALERIAVGKQSPVDPSRVAGFLDHRDTGRSAVPCLRLPAAWTSRRPLRAKPLGPWPGREGRGRRGAEWPEYRRMQRPGPSGAISEACVVSSSFSASEGEKVREERRQTEALALGGPAGPALPLSRPIDLCFCDSVTLVSLLFV